MDKSNIRILHSNILDPRFNLAFEEYLLETVKKNEKILFFWQSNNAIVIGRNQNPYQECNIMNIEKNKVVLVRRLSGGGAVYHDLGNLNFSFISQTDNFDIEKQLDIILNALKKLGINGKFNGRNDLEVEGKKFSGNAFIHEEESHLHHGTILVNTDLSKILNYLTVSHKKLETKGFDSVKSRVVNLKDISNDITIEKIIKEISNELLHKKDIEIITSRLNTSTENKIRPYLNKYYDFKWNYGDCTIYETNFEKKYNWGLVNISFEIENGKFKYIKIYTDSLITEGFEKLSDSLLNFELRFSIIKEEVEKHIINIDIRNDITKLFEENLFK